MSSPTAIRMIPASIAECPPAQKRTRTDQDDGCDETRRSLLSKHVYMISGTPVYVAIAAPPARPVAADVPATPRASNIPIGPFS
jgi:hypothetical protein